MLSVATPFFLLRGFKVIAKTGNSNFLSFSNNHLNIPIEAQLSNVSISSEIAMSLSQAPPVSSCSTQSSFKSDNLKIILSRSRFTLFC